MSVAPGSFPKGRQSLDESQIQIAAASADRASHADATKVPHECAATQHTSSPCPYSFLLSGHSVADARASSAGALEYTMGTTPPTTPSSVYVLFATSEAMSSSIDFSGKESFTFFALFPDLGVLLNDDPMSSASKTCASGVFAGVSEVVCSLLFPAPGVVKIVTPSRFGRTGVFAGASRNPNPGSNVSPSSCSSVSFKHAASSISFAAASTAACSGVNGRLCSVCSEVCSEAL